MRPTPSEGAMAPGPWIRAPEPVVTPHTGFNTRAHRMVGDAGGMKGCMKKWGCSVWEAPTLAPHFVNKTCSPGPSLYRSRGQQLDAVSTDRQPWPHRAPRQPGQDLDDEPGHQEGQAQAGEEQGPRTPHRFKPSSAQPARWPWAVTQPLWTLESHSPACYCRD